MPPSTIVFWVFWGGVVLQAASIVGETVFDGAFSIARAIPDVIAPSSVRQAIADRVERALDDKESPFPQIAGSAETNGASDGAPPRNDLPPRFHDPRPNRYAAEMTANVACFFLFLWAPGYVVWQRVATDAERENGGVRDGRGGETPVRVRRPPRRVAAVKARERIAHARARSPSPGEGE